MTRLSIGLRCVAVGIIAIGLGTVTVPAQAQEPTELTIAVFGYPSLGAFMPPVIKAKKFDTANGLDITFVERTPTAYQTQFNSGEFKIGGSATLLKTGLADARGVKAKYLFNLFDFWGGVVTSRPEIKTIKDLEGKEVAAARATTNFQMFAFFAKKLGADVDKMKVVNTAPPGLIGYAIADRAAAVQLWEPAYTLLKVKKPGIRLLDLQLDKSWNEFTGGSANPYLGVAAHTDWIEANQALIPALYAAYKAAGEYIVAHPEESAKLIAPNASAADQAALVELINSNERLRMNVVGAESLTDQIGGVYNVGIDVGYLEKMPSNDTVYDKVLK